MKKRALMLAVVAGILLSFGAPAMATTYDYFAIDDFNLPDTVYNFQVGETVTITFDIIVKAYSSTAEGRYHNANLLKWTVGEAAWNDPSDTFQITSVTVTNSGSEEDSKTNTSEYLFTIAESESGTQTYTLTIAVTGKILAAGDISVSASLYNVSNGDEPVTTTNKSNATVVAGSTQESEEITTSEEWNYNGDPANPDSNAFDGIGATFTSNPGDNSNCKAKAKVSTSKLDNFTAGTSATREITVTGPVTEINVYIAAKDTVKLFGVAKADAVDIELTQANIKAYNIPFRVTSVDFSANDNVLTGADSKEDKDGARADKTAAKSMKSIITLEFNGGYFSLKGYPITVSAKNEEMNKPATKTLKLNVEPNKDAAGWYYEDTKDVTTRVSEDLGKFDDDAQVAGLDTYTNPAFTTSSDKAKVVISGDDGYFMSSDVANVGVIVSYDQIQEGVEYNHGIAKKDKPEISVPLITGDTLGKVDASTSALTYYVSCDTAYGPLTITQKGADEDKNGVVATITQPVFNYRGELGKDNSGNEVVNGKGMVVFSGTLKKTDKESKTAVTLTVTNPSTGKKGTAKVTVIGKVPATFDTKKYPMSNDLGYKFFTTKYVEAGKVPSVKPKATGTKTITYEAYGTNTAGKDIYDVGLSFDMKKGAIVALNGKDKVTVTVNDEGEFDPILLKVSADNGVGEGDVAATYIGITGGKPALVGKTVSFAATDYTNGTFKTFDLKAGKAKTPSAATSAGADVRVTAASDADANVLSGLGLELVDWTDMTAYVSVDTALTPGKLIVASGDGDMKSFLIVSKDEDAGTEVTLKNSDYAITSDDGGIYVSPSAVNTDNQLYVRYGSEEDEDAEGNVNYKNMGIIRVTDKSKMKETKKATVNLILSNIGATNKGSIKVSIAAEATSSSSLSASSANVDPAATDKSAKDSKVRNGDATDYATDSDAQAEAEAEAEAGEVKLTFGEPRTAANLTAAQADFLAKNGYTVIAVLPEVTADKDGQAEIPAELIEDAPEGAKLVYVPFPKNAEETDDDKIADFYDEDGALIETVPAAQNITVAPWFRVGVTYEPVIAAEK